ncbi:hypothetical protein PRZ48_004864 [Zasmidium cellare]|uniref:rRNA methyltransferase 1, mitochondrial n=1 Tax=Zasmidium cellare TaxID=395010 RepID=A0ABR0EQS7_ZASCE|nr:hypothetical protein PRZ48_004864 [Zasmidium cellare]
MRLRPRTMRPRAEETAYERRSSNEPDGDLQKPRGGLFRQIKSACTLVRQIQEREAAGEGVDGMIKELRGFLKSTNYLAKSGTFKEEPSDAVAAFLQKHAAEGTFVRGEQRSSSRTVIRQRSDGELAVSVGSGGPQEQDHGKTSSSVDRKGPREPRSERPERLERRERSERPERQSWSDASSGRRREVSSSRDVEEDDDIPLPLPYTTAASEFLYGYNTVLAALRAKQRKMYKLYIHPKIFDRESGSERGLGEKAANEFVTLAKASGVPFRNEFKTKLLNRMSDGRPHNGVLLEASKLPTPPVLSLGKPISRDSTIPLNLAQQSAEDAEINGTPETIHSVANSWRHPLIVLLDGITDPGNLGNILRTCHFYGVDAVAVATNTCANLSSAVLAKASSGACEAVRLLSLPQPSNFAYESARNGWKIYASVAPTPDVVSQSTHLTTASVATASPLAKHPCILMLGAEGEGLRENLRNRAHATVSIERGKKIKGTPDVGVDSINVGVAAGVLMDAFLRKPSDAPEKIDTRSDLGW